MGKITDSNYKQCTLERQVENGVAKTRTWLPEKFAVKGKTVDLKGDNGEWTRDWEVKSVGSNVIDGETANRMSRAWAKHREATDI